MFILSMLGNLGSGALGGLGSMLHGLLGFAGGTVRGVLGIFAGGVLGFVSLLKSSMDALREFSRTVISLSNQSGASRRQSLDLVNSFRALGISPEETASTFGNRGMHPQLFNMRAGGQGAPNINDPGFILKLQSWYQGMVRGTSLMGFLNGRARLDSVFGGNAPDSILNLVNMRPQTTKRELGWHASLQSKLGLSPEILTQANEDLSLLINRVGVFADTVRMKFTAELLPSLNAVFGGVSELFLKNANGISGMLKGFGHWMFVEMPDLAIKGMRTMIGWGEGLSNIFLDLGDGIIDLVRMMHGREGGLYRMLSGIAKFYDGITDLTVDFGAGLAVARQVFENSLFLWSKTPLGMMISRGAGLEFQWKDPSQAATDYYNQYKPSNHIGAFNKWVESPDTAKWIGDRQAFNDNLRSSRSNTAVAANELADRMAKYAGTKEEREILYKIYDELKDGNQDVVDAITHAATQTGNMAALGHVGASYAMRSARLRRT